MERLTLMIFDILRTWGWFASSNPTKYTESQTETQIGCQIIPKVVLALIPYQPPDCKHDTRLRTYKSSNITVVHIDWVIIQEIRTSAERFGEELAYLKLRNEGPFKLDLRELCYDQSLTAVVIYCSATLAELVYRIKWLVILKFSGRCKQSTFVRFARKSRQSKTQSNQTNEETPQSHSSVDPNPVRQTKRFRRN